MQANKRSELHRIIIDTPALLNMVKHCREGNSNSSQGFCMGVAQKEMTASGEVDNLFITQTMPEARNTIMTQLL